MTTPTPLPLRTFGAGTPVVLLHGSPTDPRHLEGLAQALAGDFRAIVVDLPGYAGSPWIDPYSWEAAHEALATTLEGAGATTLHAVGFSGGAWRAVRLALDPRFEVRTLSLLGPTIGADDPAVFQQTAAAIRAGLVTADVMPARMLSQAYAAAHPEACDEVKRWIAPIGLPRLADELEAFATAEHLGPKLAQLGMPTLVRNGELDVATPAASAKAIAAKLPKARYEEVAGAGHALLVEDFAATAASVHATLRSAP